MRIVLISFFSILSFVSMSQNMISIMDTNNQWFVQYAHGNRPGGYLAVLEFQGDTIVDDKKYNKLIKRTINENTQEFIGCLRADTNGDIRFCPPHENKEYLLYPSSLSVSMNVHVFTRHFRDQMPGNEMIQLLTIDSTFVVGSEGNFFQSYILHRNCAVKGYQTWVEGIGSTNGPLENYIPEHCIENGVSIEISGKFSSILIAFKKADEILYFDQSYLSYYESVTKVRRD